MSSKNNLKIAVVCLSNLNRSMEAHELLLKNNFNVKSFGASDRVRLFIGNITKTYDFYTPYERIYEEALLQSKTQEIENGVLGMLDRNRKIKNCPEKFIDCADNFNIVFTCEERVFFRVLKAVEDKKPDSAHTCHVINIKILDNFEETAKGAALILELCTILCEKGLKNVVDEVKSFAKIKNIDFMYKINIHK